MVFFVAEGGAAKRARPPHALLTAVPVLKPGFLAAVAQPAPKPPAMVMHVAAAHLAAATPPPPAPATPPAALHMVAATQVAATMAPNRLPTAKPPLTVSLTATPFLKPHLASVLVPFLQPDAGVPRSRLQAPVAPSAKPTDGELFEGAQDPSARFYLPQYRLAEESAGGRTRFRVALAQDAQGGSLTVFLVKHRAPALEVAGRDASELKHAFEVRLTYRLRAEGRGELRKELAFQEASEEGDAIRAVLRLASLPELTQVYEALTGIDLGTSLTVRRVATVAVPVDLGPRIAGLEAELAKTDRRIAEIRARQTALQKRLVTLTPFHAAASAQIRRQLAQLEAELRTAAADGEARRQERDRLRSTPLFREGPLALDHAVAPDPFVFSAQMHPYVTAGVTPGASGASAIVRRTVAWEGRHHAYFQEGSSHVFYYLPDSFKLARRPDPPHAPMVTVEMPAAPASAGDTRVSLTYVAAPHVDAERLAAAAAALRPFVSPLPPGVEGPSFQPLHSATPRLLLSYPRHDMPGGPLEARDKAVVDLAAGIQDLLSLTLEQFQTLYDALFGGSDVFFQGEVHVPVGDDEPAERVPFSARMDDTVGDVLAYSEVPDAETGGLRARLRNVIESPVRIHALEATLVRGEAGVPAVVEGAAWPHDLPPGAHLEVSLRPSAPLAGSGATTALFDVERVEVVPDPEKVWDAIFERARAPEYTRSIRVKAFAPTFAAPPGRPEGQVLALVVKFEGGQAADLGPEKLEETVEVRLPVADYVLRHAGQGDYRYRLVVVRGSGLTEDEEWRTDKSDILLAVP